MKTGSREQPKANVGDIVACAGYGRNRFEVESRAEKFFYDKDGSDFTITYGLIPLGMNDYIIGFNEDITVIRRSDSKEVYVREYLKRNGYSKYSVEKDKYSLNLDDIFVKGSEKGLTSITWVDAGYEQGDIDAILEQIYDTRQLVELVGDDGENKYEAYIEELKDKLREITAEERR